jgi:DNA-directed RNA polymerase subunit K/omega
MVYYPLEGMTKVGLNPYEAIIVAAQHARNINSQRLAQIERLEEDPGVFIDPRKITMVALKEVIEGKVQFKRTDSHQ